MKQFGALDPTGPSRDGHASVAERRAASGSGMGDWLVNVRGDVVVPMTTAEIVEGLRAAKLSERSLVWRLGMLDWIVLGDVPQLRLAGGAALSSAPPPASARVASARVEPPPTEVQAESQRRRNTLPFGFPAARDSASVRQPSGLKAPAPQVKPAPAPATPMKPAPAPRAAAVPRPTLAAPIVPITAASDESTVALAVYERPAASLTFSDSVAAEWRGESRPAPEPPAPRSAGTQRMSERKLSPMPAPSAPLPQSANVPHSLAPTTFEALGATSSRPASGYADLSVVLAADFRAAKASSKRWAVFGALGSALFASAITVWLMRAPTPELATTNLSAQPVAVQPLPAPPAAPPVVPAAAPAQVAAKAQPAAPRVPRAPLRARVKPRPMPAVSATAAPVSDNPYPANEEREPSGAATPQLATTTTTTTDTPPAPATPSVEPKSQATPSAPAPAPATDTSSAP